MKTYLLSIPDRLRRKSETLDVKTYLCGKQWNIVNDEGVNQIFIFREDSSLIISTNGDVVYSSWQYLAEQHYLLITSGDKSNMFSVAYFDNNNLALNKVGIQEYLLMTRENCTFSFDSISNFQYKIDCENEKLLQQEKALEEKRKEEEKQRQLNQFLEQLKAQKEERERKEKAAEVARQEEEARRKKAAEIARLEEEARRKKYEEQIIINRRYEKQRAAKAYVCEKYANQIKEVREKAVRTKKRAPKAFIISHGLAWILITFYFADETFFYITEDSPLYLLCADDLYGTMVVLCIFLFIYGFIYMVIWGNEGYVNGRVSSFIDRKVKEKK